MKKIFSILFILVVYSLQISAQTQERKTHTAEERAARLTEWMKSNLSLTKEQLPKVQEINLRYAKKMDDLKNSSADRKQKVSKLKKEDAAKDAELKAVLTESQFKTYLAKKEELKEKMKEKRKEKK